VRELEYFGAPWEVAEPREVLMRRLQLVAMLVAQEPLVSDSAASKAPRGMPTSCDRPGSAMDIHYHVSSGVVHVDEAEKTRRFETFFMKQIQNNQFILQQLDRIKIEL